MSKETPPDVVNLQKESSVDWLQSTRDETDDPDDPTEKTVDADDEIGGAGAELSDASDLADLVESSDLKITLDDDCDVDDLREFLARAEAGEFDTDLAPEDTVWIVRSLLEDDDDPDPDE